MLMQLERITQYKFGAGGKLDDNKLLLQSEKQPVHK
jgi:hypothetical protein